ncbi:MAG: dihydrofolate reductase [Rhodospirillaceae bacterium]
MNGENESVSDAVTPSASVSVAMIVARASNGVIGRGGKLPWHVSADLQHFKRLTVGKPIIMGRKTYDSIGRPLPRRTNIVVTRTPGWTAEGCVTAADLPNAFALAYEEALRTGAAEIVVIGGSEIYRQALKHAVRIYLTEVHRDYEGDAVLDLDLAGWDEVSRERHNGENDEEPDFSFVELRRQE